jgi:hypothetical protein
MRAVLKLRQFGEVSEQLPLKNTVSQGFSLRNRKTCEETNRVSEQVY